MDSERNNVITSQEDEDDILALLSELCVPTESHIESQNEDTNSIGDPDDLFDRRTPTNREDKDGSLTLEKVNSASQSRFSKASNESLLPKKKNDVSLSIASGGSLGSTELNGTFFDSEESPSYSSNESLHSKCSRDVEVLEDQQSLTSFGNGNEEPIKLDKKYEDQYPYIVSNSKNFYKMQAFGFVLFHLASNIISLLFILLMNKFRSIDIIIITVQTVTSLLSICSFMYAITTENYNRFFLHNSVLFLIAFMVYSFDSSLNMNFDDIVYINDYRKTEVTLLNKRI